MASTASGATSSASKPIPSIPVLDISLLRTAREEELVVAWDAAFRTNGFVFLSGHGLGPQYRKMLERAKEFFIETPQEEKLKYYLGKGYGFGGYVPQGVESVSANNPLETDDAGSSTAAKARKRRPPDAVENLATFSPEADLMPDFMRAD